MRWWSLFFGAAFGFLIGAAGFSEYDTVHNMLLLREPHAYLLMGSAVAVAMPLLWILERRKWQTPLGGAMKLARTAIERKNILGAALFGVGWAIAGTCPVPALTMLASGGLLALVVIGGFLMGIVLRDNVATKQGKQTESVELAPAPAQQLP